MNGLTRREILIIICALLAILLVWLFLWQAPTDQGPDMMEEDKTSDTAPTENTSPTQTKTPTTKTTPTTPVPQSSTPVLYATVTYTNSGFSPSLVTVKSSGAVKFVNKSDRAMRILGSLSNSETSQNEDFDQGKSVGRNGFFEFNFGPIGVWTYVNSNRLSDTGFVVVVPK